MRLQHILAGLFVIYMTTLPAQAGGINEMCDGKLDLALVLAIDVSGSISDDEMGTQQRGYVQAFRNPEVISSILKNKCGVAVTVMMWADGDVQKQMVPWSVLNTKESILTFANQINSISRISGNDTSIVGALIYSMWLFERLPYGRIRQIIDISGDGRDSSPVSLETLRLQNPSGNSMSLGQAQSQAYKKGITINGLSIQDEEADIHEYYRTKVITPPPDGFLVPIEDVNDFSIAIRQKLVIEMSLLAH